MINIKIAPFQGQKIEAIIFDLGGVLLNLDFKRSYDAFAELGFGNAEDEMKRLLLSRPSGENMSFFHLYEKGMIGSARFRDELRKFSDKQPSDEAIDRAWTAMLLDLHQENVILLEKLKKYTRLYLLSNTNAIHIETMHGRKDNGPGYSHLAGLFDKVYYSHEVNMRKPDREIFDHVVSDAGLIPENTLFIDDSVHNIEGAKAAGLQAYHHTAGTSLEPVFNIR
jgi:glucose-1-phosphatase